MKEDFSQMSRTTIIPANDPKHNGVWRFRVSYYDSNGPDDTQ